MYGLPQRDDPCAIEVNLGKLRFLWILIGIKMSLPQTWTRKEFSHFEGENSRSFNLQILWVFPLSSLLAMSDSFEFKTPVEVGKIYSLVMGLIGICKSFLLISVFSSSPSLLLTSWSRMQVLQVPMRFCFAKWLFHTPNMSEADHTPRTKGATNFVPFAEVIELPTSTNTSPKGKVFRHSVHYHHYHIIIIVF